MQQLHDYQAPRSAFLPVCKEDLSPGSELDIIFVTGDAYVDHPSFGTALLARILENQGYRVGIIAQPDWRSTRDFTRLGRPRLAFFVTAGNMDSMVANYTVAGKPRKDDAYSPGGLGGRRPDRATLVYCTRIREAFKQTDIVIGGIEASLRRFAHYDYWSNSLRRSMLIDSKADLLVYGMAERSVVEIARQLSAGRRAGELQHIPGTLWRCRAEDAQSIQVIADTWPSLIQDDAAGLPEARLLPRKIQNLPGWEDLKDPRLGKNHYSQSFLAQHRNTDALNADILTEAYGPWLVVQNPPALPLSASEFDALYTLPFTRTFHPDYLEAGGVPAIEEVRFSLVSSRGCFGGCSFCALTFHQGRRIQARSGDSLVREAELLTRLPGFKGYIHDVGGPTANFRRPACEKQRRVGVCKDRQCLHPRLCNQLVVDHQDYLGVLRRLRSLEGIKKVFIRSGIRFDYLLGDSNGEFLTELCAHHVSGKLKVAPEHISPRALAAMGKPRPEVFQQFAHAFKNTNQRLGKNQFMVPYFISSHPGTTLADALELALYFRDQGGTPEQVQDFYPTPGTLATCMYYTGIDPRTGREIYVSRSYQEKAMQRALLQFRDPKNHGKVRQALETLGRTDLIGQGKQCLVPGAFKSPPGKPGADQKRHQNPKSRHRSSENRRNTPGGRGRSNHRTSK
ncbi:YgiQ family radical SAM protein [Spirochaeta lutea]|uniref:YgiQ family radical SAM protein n=1 Tax=Spirochaeta lutea TaxID=1480694 RepID=UPI0006923B8E|nr:YgiQ family radical SAM protein [Spirochaeta lutea]